MVLTEPTEVSIEVHLIFEGGIGLVLSSRII